MRTRCGTYERTKSAGASRERSHILFMLPNSFCSPSDHVKKNADNVKMETMHTVGAALVYSVRFPEKDKKSEKERGTVTESQKERKKERTK